MADNDRTLERLWDLEEIRRLKARYFRLMDTKDWEHWKEVFTDDCVHHLPQETGRPPIGNEEYFRDVPAQLADAVTTHFGFMPEITFLSDTEAEGIWAMFDYVQYPALGTGAKGYGHYFETYRKGEDGVWRISSKRNVRIRLDQAPCDVQS